MKTVSVLLLSLLCLALVASATADGDDGLDSVEDRFADGKQKRFTSSRRIIRIVPCNCFAPPCPCDDPRPFDFLRNY